MEEFFLSDEQIAELILKVYLDEISIDNLSQEVFDSDKNTLMTEIYKGFDGDFTSFEFESEQWNLLKSFEENTYAFSSAKSYQEVKSLQSLIINPNTGFKRPFTDYSRLVKDQGITEAFNRNWLRTEQQTAFRQATAGRFWSDAQQTREIFPFLQYKTVGDNRVRDFHRTLNNVIKRIDDPFWNTYTPPIDWACRCRLRKLTSGEITDTSTRDLPVPNELFKTNPGKTGEVFNRDHPYFKVDGREAQLNNNFGLGNPPDRTNRATERGI